LVPIVTTNARLAFKILTVAIERDGEIPKPEQPKRSRKSRNYNRNQPSQPAPAIPTDTRCVKLEAWRERYCGESGIERPRNQQTSFVRAYERLLVDDLIGRHSEWVWTP